MHTLVSTVSAHTLFAAPAGRPGHIQERHFSLQLQSKRIRIECSKAAAMNRPLDAASKRTGIIFKGGTNRYILGVERGKQNALLLSYRQCYDPPTALLRYTICISYEYEKQQHKDGIENQQQER